MVVGVGVRGEGADWRAVSEIISERKTMMRTRSTYMYMYMCTQLDMESRVYTYYSTLEYCKTFAHCMYTNTYSVLFISTNHRIDLSFLTV